MKAPDTNPAPFTVSVNPPLPGATLVGTSGWLISGTGFDFASTTVLARIRKRRAKRNRLMEHLNARLFAGGRLLRKNGAPLFYSSALPSERAAGRDSLFDPVQIKAIVTAHFHIF